MPKRSLGLRPPTKQQREIGERFKTGASVREIAGPMPGPYWMVETLVERAIRACLTWERRNG